MESIRAYESCPELYRAAMLRGSATAGISEFARIRPVMALGGKIPVETGGRGETAF